MSEDDVRVALTTFIKQNLVPDEPYDIDEDTPLLERGILDSLKTAMLLNYVRDGLGAPVPPYLIDSVNFRSVRTIAALVSNLTSVRN